MTERRFRAFFSIEARVALRASRLRPERGPARACERTSRRDTPRRPRHGQHPASAGDVHPRKAAERQRRQHHRPGTPRVPLAGIAFPPEVFIPHAARAPRARRERRRDPRAPRPMIRSGTFLNRPSLPLTVLPLPNRRWPRCRPSSTSPAPCLPLRLLARLEVRAWVTREARTSPRWPARARPRRCASTPRTRTRGTSAPALF